MTKRSLLICLTLALPLAAQAAPMTPAEMHAAPLIGKLMIDRLETFHTPSAGNGQSWQASGWYGSQFNRIGFKTEGEREDNQTANADVELFASHAIAPFWDARLGLRHDVDTSDKPARDWAAIGINGIAPYWFELDASLYLGNDARSGLKLEASYELRITQRLIMQPSVEASAWGKEDETRGLGKGLASIDAGLRLRYEIKRQFAPYLGVSRGWLFDDTKAMAAARGENSSGTRWLAGIRFWF